MNKKIGVSILIGVLVLIVVIGVTKGVVDSEANANNMFNASMVLYGDGYAYDNTTKGSVTEIVNLTVNHDGVSGGNISEINVTWSGNVTFDGFINSADLLENFGDVSNQSDPHNNVTILADGSVANWACYNNSGGSLTSQGISCHYLNSDNLLSADNATLIIRFNITADSSIEDRNMWNISVTDIATNTSNANSTVLYTYVDGLEPRLGLLNISDGNMTYGNGTSNIVFNGSVSEGYATYLDANSDLIVRATFYELNPDFNSMRLFYNATDGVDMVQGGSIYTDLVNTNATIVSGSCEPGTLASGVDFTGWAHQITCNWTIPARISINSGGTSNETVVFGFAVNDTFDYNITVNDTYAGRADTPFSVLTNETLPYVSSINVSDEHGNSITKLDGTEYLNSNTTIVFTISGASRAVISNVSEMITIYYNETGVLSTLTNGIIENYENETESLGFIDVSGNISGTNTQIYNLTAQGEAFLTNPTSTSLYSVGFTAGNGNDTNTLSFVIVIGNTSFDNLINGNYTTTAGPYSFKMDATAPGITIERVTSESGINQYDSVGVEYKCSATDVSGIEKYVWTLDKPGADNVITEHGVSTTSDTITFKNNDLNVLGNYIVKCKVYDGVDNYEEKITDASTGFTVSAAAAAGVSGAGGAGGAAVVSFDIDFTTANEGTLKAQQGRVKSFSFDGVTKHTITFMEVTASSATLKIESTPVTVTLNVRDTKNVDVNSDGVNDMSVVLNSIVNGVADVTIRKIEEGAAKIVKEEEAARGITEEVTTPVTPVEKKGLTWLWVLIAIIVIAALGYYFFNKKK